VTALLAALALGDALELRLAPGAVHSYSLTRTYASEDGEETTKWIEQLEYVLGEDDPAQATLRRRTLEITLDGTALPSKAPQWTVGTLRIASDGTVMRRETQSEDGPVLARHLRPLEVRLRGSQAMPGATWTVREGALPEGWLGPATWTYTVLEAGDATVRLSAKFAEEGDSTAIRGEGEVVLDRKSGWPVRQSFVVRPVVQPLDEEGVPCTLRLDMALR
jgi:hypothetical protein